MIFNEKVGDLMDVKKYLCDRCGRENIGYSIKLGNWG